MENELESTFIHGEKLFITDQTKLFLKEISKWTKFLSILGFIGIGIMVLFSLFIGVILSFISHLQNVDNLASFPSGLLSVIYLIFAAVYVVPVYYLFKFSTNLRNALDFNNVSFLENAFCFLKSHYKFTGIMTIVFISLYVLFFIGAIVIGSIAAFV